ncbi:MAG: LysR family transcriptional regulator [Angelakisella sp.]|nr:LysR family transcriptional regulator [Angelakisella sp.]
MNVKDFEYIVEIAKYGSITKAASALYITQPALTKFLIRVERELGIQLFHRVGKHFVLTEAGKTYVDKAQSILHLNTQLMQEMDDIATMRSGTTRIGITVGRNRYITTTILPKFMNMYPLMKITIELKSTEILIEHILNYRLDFIIANFTNPHPLLNHILLGEDELVLVVSKNDPIIEKADFQEGLKYPVIDPKYIENFPLILTHNTSRSYKMALEYFVQVGLDPFVVAELQDVRSVMDIVSTGVGRGIFISVPISKKDNLAYLSLGKSNLPKQKTAIITRKGFYLERAKLDMIALIESNYH